MTCLADNRNHIYRILDANLNRLREALRVIEEYYRFMDEREDICITLKEMRHTLIQAEQELGKELLLRHRDTARDCFAHSTRPEELARAGVQGLLCANFKRGQEATRVIEEYSKIVAAGAVPEMAKQMRFDLYNLEKKLVTGTTHETD
jgi:hypothetical protein